MYIKNWSCSTKLQNLIWTYYHLIRQNRKMQFLRSIVTACMHNGTSVGITKHDGSNPGRHPRRYYFPSSGAWRSDGTQKRGRGRACILVSFLSLAFLIAQFSSKTGSHFNHPSLQFFFLLHFIFSSLPFLLASSCKPCSSNRILLSERSEHR